MKRFRQGETSYNANMQHKEVETFCQLPDEGHKMLAQVLKKHKLSGRAHDSILKVARTIADLDQSAMIKIHHLTEAVNYRCFDKEINY